MFELGLFWILASLRLRSPKGRESLIAENALLRHQLAILRRKQGLKKCPRLSVEDKVIFGTLGGLLTQVQLLRSAIIIKPSTVLKFHRMLVNFKYRILYRSKPKRTGPDGPSRELIALVIDMKIKNPHMGCLQIAQMISKNFDFKIDKNTVHRILKKYLPSSESRENESWLALFGVKKDKLWSRISSEWSRPYSSHIG